MQSKVWMTVRQRPAAWRVGNRRLGRGPIARLGLRCLTSLIALVAVAPAFAAPEFSAAEIYRNSASSVVLIFGFGESGPGNSGSGSILTRDGLVLTNNHVIANSNTGRLFPNLVVYRKPVPISGDNRKDLTTPLLVEVVARDAELDLALLRIKDAPSDLRPIEIADSEEIEVGESVAAIGHPGGGGLWTLTTGTISSKRRDRSRDIFQTDTAINPGNSGGPLLDRNSRMIGINTFVRRVDDQGLPLEGLNYSLRSSFALRWVNQQGVARIVAVSRSPIARRGGDERRTTPASDLTLALRPLREVNASDLEPAPVPRVEPQSDLEPMTIRPVPAPLRPSPLLDPKAREFQGTNGESMYGVPNPMIDLHEALVEVRKSYEALTRRADESVDEMNRLLDDYDNF